ncbi:MAG: hypothetical protein H6810_02700 [Phycisphaeraceae bacterium]|nr:MAG: hypothetical protein H6810_02700 [Phycisphaeraceae bacterium]
MFTKAPGLGRPLFETVHAVSAGLWLGSLVMSAATAGLLFGTMRSLDPSFGFFSAYTGPQSDLGAGYIQNRIFLAGDVMQFIGATGSLAATIALIGFCGLSLRRVSTGIRVFALGAAMALVSYHLFVLVPRMQTNAHAYWEAARAGEMDAATTAYDAFQADHPTARNEMLATTVVVALMLGAGAWSAATTGRPDEPITRDDRSPRARPASRLEEPKLARSTPGGRAGGRS